MADYFPGRLTRHDRQVACHCLCHERAAGVTEHLPGEQCICKTGGPFEGWP